MRLRPNLDILLPACPFWLGLPGLWDDEDAGHDYWQCPDGEADAGAAVARDSDATAAAQHLSTASAGGSSGVAAQEPAAADPELHPVSAVASDPVAAPAAAADEEEGPSDFGGDDFDDTRTVDFTTGRHYWHLQRQQHQAQQQQQQAPHEQQRLNQESASDHFEDPQDPNLASPGDVEQPSASSSDSHLPPPPPTLYRMSSEEFLRSQLRPRPAHETKAAASPRKRKAAQVLPRVSCSPALTPPCSMVWVLGRIAASGRACHSARWSAATAVPQACCARPAGH